MLPCFRATDSEGFVARVRKDLSRSTAFEDPHDLAFAASFGDLAFDVFMGGLIRAHPRWHDGVDGRVQVRVAAAVEPISECVPRGCRERTGSRDPR